MHYNPVSVALAERVVRELAEEDQLGAVALEVCPSRWDSTLRARPRGSLLRRICDNEFQAAAEVAEDFSCGLALADQSIEVTSGRLAQLAKQTVVQLFTGEAEAVRRDIGVGWRALQGEGVRAGAYVSPGLLLGAPVALLRYLAGSPILPARCSRSSPSRSASRRFPTRRRRPSSTRPTSPSPVSRRWCCSA